MDFASSIGRAFAAFYNYNNNRRHRRGLNRRRNNQRRHQRYLYRNHHNNREALQEQINQADELLRALAHQQQILQQQIDGARGVVQNQPIQIIPIVPRPPPPRSSQIHHSSVISNIPQPPIVPSTSQPSSTHEPPGDTVPSSPAIP